MIVELVHRFQLLDDQHNPTGNFVLVNVSSANGDFPLRIGATEGEVPYRAEISQHDASKLRDSKHQKSKEEWRATLRSILLQHQPLDTTQPTTGHENFEIVAILSPTELSIIVRKNIDGIIHRLGEIPLRRDEDYEIDTIAWTHNAITRGNFLASELRSLRSKFSDQEATIAKLSKQLEDLVNAKKEHETALMTKFCELLNTKKLKIRDQQRLLASAKVDPDLAAKVRASRANGGQRSPAGSRKGKRKAVSPDQDADGDEEAFTEARDVKRDDSEEEEQRRTPDTNGDDQDTTEDESDKNEMAERKDTTELPDQSKPAATDHQDVDMDESPPNRDLPFQDNYKSKDSGPQKADQSTLQHEAGNGGDETTDDDEL